MSVIAGSTEPPNAVAPQSQPAGGLKPFQPGVRIDWPRRCVEVDGAVVLRSGYLELFACAGDFKAHESIVRVDARPLHVFQALGLVGLTPGRPARFDRATQRVISARGESVMVRVRWEAEGRTHVAEAHEWMKDLAANGPARPGRWLFTGSMRLPDGEFGAETDGVLVATVGFPTALVVLDPGSIGAKAAKPAASSAPANADSSSRETENPSARGAAGSSPSGDGASDAEGVYVNQPEDPQLSADPRRVPPVGTRVTLLLSPAGG